MVDAAFLHKEGYWPVKLLPATGQMAGVMPMIFTAGLFVGLDTYGYARRYCYASATVAAACLLLWDGTGDPPGPWIKEKGGPMGERLGPGATDP